jgi:protein-export membrane protein SecD
MKKTSKAVFFVLLALILAFTGTSLVGIRVPNGDIMKTYIKGVEDIRWGIDIRGGVDATFSPADGYDATDEQMAAAESILRVRMVSQNITDYEIYTDAGNHRIIVRFPWRADESDFDPEEAIRELGETALLTFREGYNVDEFGLPTGVTASNVVLEGKDVVAASAVYQTDQTGSGNAEPVVQLELTAEGAQKFSTATAQLVGQVISIWMDDTMISSPVVNQQIVDGNAVISGQFSPEEAMELADRISAGALPFKMTTANYNTISPTLGTGARDAMALALFIAYVVVSLYMIFWYRLPGVIAMICLAGHIGLMVSTLTGYFDVFPSFTLTLPGIAGIILSIGMGVDANVITAERIKEEIKNGKSIDSALQLGYKRAFSAILDGNITVIIVAVLLMGAFGPPTSFLSRMFSPIFFFFDTTAAGNIYSFGFTLLVGVLANFIMGIFASRLMVQSIAKQKPLRKAWLFGGDK